MLRRRETSDVSMLCRSSVVAVWLAISVGLVWTRALAQELSTEATDRAVRAAVRIVVPGPNGEPLASGSGSVIDARGYVLTNFHVVGHVSAEHGMPGTLLIPENLFEIALVDSARESARPRYLARVVRGDARLDLALLQIVALVDRQPLPRGLRFRAVELANTRNLRPGSRVWAFGYPLGVRTINVTGGQVTGFQMNADDGIAWLRSDAEFNPGNSGGMLVDARGRLVAVPTAVVHGRSTLEPIELARPAERIPREWLEAIRRGIDDVRIDGVPELREGLPLADAAVGDSGGLGQSEILFYRLAENVRPARISTNTPAIELVLADTSGRVVRRGAGAIEVGPADPPRLMLAAVVANRGEGGLRFELRLDRLERREPARTATIPPPFGGVSGVSEPRAMPGPPPSMGAQPPPLPPPMPMPPGPRASIEGRVVDGADGRPLGNVLILVGRPGADLGRQLAFLLEGRMSEADFFAQLAGAARSDAGGRYRVSGLPTNTRFPAAAFVYGRRPVMLELTVGAEGSSIDLGVIPIGP